jgi:hypothetical protein
MNITTGSLSLIGLSVPVFQAAKPIARGFDQRLACRDDMNWNAPHHIFEATLSLESIHKSRLFQHSQQM